MMNMQSSYTAPMTGLEDPVQDSQAVFRAVLEAMSYPGKAVTVSCLDDAPLPLNTATAAVCLSLVDFETPLWTDTEIASSSDAMNFLRFHCGCPVTMEPNEARTALVADARTISSFERFNTGSDERPELSTTLIIQVDNLVEGEGVRLTGPGIETSRKLTVEGVGPDFWNAVIANSGLFPRGVDMILSCHDRIVCLPRTTKVEV